ncbi:MAG: exosome complex protein Rrp4 [Methanobrevibacter sp.]|nr:exosome complex protein Rrp4 [Methanobrevibacter sp.]
MIYVKEKDLVVPGELLAEDDYYSGRGTFEDDGKICSKLLGLVSLRNKKISVIPLKSKYLPKKGDVVIGKIDDVRFSMWGVDINSPYSGILPASEVFGREKKELSRVFDVGDVLFLRIVDVDEVKKVKLGLKGRGMGKFRGGVIVDIAPTKVPRLIGKKGSMINMIKDKTGCKIVVGQNGLVWVKGNEDMEQIVKNTIKTIEREAHTSGLTDRIKNQLCLLIDGELPEEETEEEEEEVVESFEEGLKKPEIQDFREEVEQEIAEELALEEESKNIDDSEEEDSEEDFEDIDDSEEEDFEDETEDIDDSEEEDFEDSLDDEDLDDSEDDEDESDDADSEIVGEEIIELDESDDVEADFNQEEDIEKEIAEGEVEEVSDDELEEAISEAISEDDSPSDALEDEESLSEDENSESEDKEEDEDEKEDDDDQSKKPKFLDTFEYINEQKKKNKSSFDLSRADNSKSPTLNISQGRGI